MSTTSRAFPKPPAPRALASIDVGSGSVLLTVLEAEGGRGRYRILEELCLVTGLGRHKGADGSLHPASVERTFDALAHYARRLADLGVEACRCIGTSALRDAPGGPAFVGRVKADLGLDLQILPGEEEARLTWLANQREFGHLGRRVVVDIGAGSTEFVCGEGPRPDWAISLDLGSVRHTERFLRGDPPTAASLATLRAALAEEVRRVPDPTGPVTLVGVAGTVTTLLAVREGLVDYDPARVHGAFFTIDELDAVLARIDAVPNEERRRIPGMHPQRADVMPAGGEILRAALVRFGADHLVVSDRGIRFGAIYDRWDVRGITT